MRRHNVYGGHAVASGSVSQLVDRSLPVQPPERLDLRGPCGEELLESGDLGVLLGLLRRPVPDPLLDEPQGQFVVVGQLVGHSARVVDDPGDQPDAEGLLGVDDPARQREVERVAEAHHLRQPDRPAPGAEQPERDARLAEGRPRRRHPNVAGERELDASPASGAVDAGHDDRVGVLDGGRDALSPADESFDVVVPVVTVVTWIRRGLFTCGVLGHSRVIGDSGVLSYLGRLGHLPDDLQVCAGTERVAGAAEVDDWSRGGLDCSLELFEPLRCQGVPSRRPVERDDPDVPVVVDLDHGDTSTLCGKGLAQVDAWELGLHPPQRGFRYR